MTSMETRVETGPVRPTLEGADEVVRSADPLALGAIRRPDVTLAILDRPLPDFAAALEAADEALLPQGVATVPGEAGAGSGMLRERLSIPAIAPFSDLADDIGLLVALFRTATGACAVRIRLQALAHDGCRYFHTDRVGVRLITTWFGPSTEYVPDRAARRDCLGQGDNEAVVPDSTAIRTLGAGCVGLFKGDLGFAGGPPGAGIIHRSPPVTASGARRYMLVIDDASSIGF